MNKKTNNNEFKLSLLITFGILIIIWILIGTIKFRTDEDYIINNSIFDTDLFYNNTGQTLQYISALIGFTILFPITYLIIKNKKLNFKYTNIIFNIFIILLILFSIGIGGTNLFSSALLIIIALLIYYKVYNNYNSINRIVIKKQKLIIILISIFTSLLYIDNSYQQSFFLMHHVTAYYYPIHKILNGLTPYIDFNSLYGGYCYIYVLILKAFPQNMHLLVFSIITSLLIFISLILTYRFLKKIIKNENKIIFVYLPFLLCNIYLIYALENSTYIQYMPHRYLSMSIMMNYILYILKNNTIKKTILGYLICSLMMFWNFDSGIIVAISYTLFIIYSQIYNRKYKNILITLPLLIISTIIPFTLIEIITYIRIGYLSNIKDILFSTLLFSNEGFLSLKLEYISAPWVLALIGYLFFFGNAITNLIEKKENDSINCFLSVLGLGIFIYYIERSVIIKFVFIIVPLLFLITNFKDKKNKILCELLHIFLSIACIICLLISIKYKFLSNKIDKEIKKQKENLDSFSEKVGKENFEMYINCDTIYYELLGKKDTKKLPSYLDIFKKEDLEKLIKYIEETDKNVIVSFELFASHQEKILTKKIKNKYYIYYKYEKENQDNYVFFIKKQDIKKITDLNEYRNIEELRLEEING